MTDRNLRADQLVHAARAAGQPQPDLREQLAEALRAAAFLCDDCCTLEDEAACDAAHPIQATVLHYDVVTDISGPIDDIADAALAVVRPLLDAKQTETDALRTDLAKAQAERQQYYTALQGTARRAALDAPKEPT